MVVLLAGWNAHDPFSALTVPSLNSKPKDRISKNARLITFKVRGTPLSADGTWLSYQDWYLILPRCPFTAMHGLNPSDKSVEPVQMRPELIYNLSIRKGKENFLKVSCSPFWKVSALSVWTQAKMLWEGPFSLSVQGGTRKEWSQSLKSPQITWSESSMTVLERLVYFSFQILTNKH